MSRPGPSDGSGDVRTHGDRKPRHTAAPQGDASLPPATDATGSTGAEPPSRLVRVLVVDDHAILREGIASLLSMEPDLQIVGQACDGIQAVEMALALRPDVVIMDVTLPRLNGPQATALIMRGLPQTRVIGLSMHQGQEMEEIMLRAGACAYLTKDGSDRALVEAIRRHAPRHPSP